MTKTVEPKITVLDMDAKLNVQYAVPLWLRDEQIKYAIEHVSGRIQAVPEPRADSVAVVGFGATLLETWEKLKDFKYIISCSGAHRFLIDRGIVPTWHVEVDPRPHKIKLLGEPHPDVEYLAASACAPAYLEHLKNYNLKLWHVFDPTDEGIRMLPPGEWAVTGGCDVGLRSMTIAAFLGFRDVHVFGIDGSAAAPGEPRHAGDHPNGVQKYAKTEYPKGSGKEWWTTPAMLSAAKQVAHELDQMPTVKVTFYGDALIQTMIKGYKPKDRKVMKDVSDIIAFAKPEVISSEYAALNRQLHTDNLAYGVGGGKHAETVLKISKSLDSTSILDYGCGKGYLAKQIPFPIWEYDPAIAGKEASPRPADIVVCTDVLEHIEPEKLVYVLSDLKRVTKKVGYFTIHTGPAIKLLADGRNAHLIQKDKKWWTKQLQKFFKIGKISQVGPELYVVVGTKTK